MSEPDLSTVAADPSAFQAAITIPSAHGPRQFGSVMADFQRERFAAINPALEAIATGEKPKIGRYWWEATKGASKDSDLAACILWLLAFSRRALAMQVGAADADQADELRKAALDILRLNTWLGRLVKVQASKIIGQLQGSGRDATPKTVCDIISADVAGSHGARPDVLVINELSHITKREFAENLMDNAAKVPNGLVVIATNAGFKGTWQHKWREQHRGSKRCLVHILNRPSDWLAVDAEALADIEGRNSHSRFRRLWWGDWSSGAGDALDEEDLNAAVDSRLAPLPGRTPGFGFVGGLDLGIKHDHAAFVVLGKDHRTNRIRLAHAQFWEPGFIAGLLGKKEVDLMAVEESVVANSKRFGTSLVAFDPHQAALMAQRCRYRGVCMKETPFTGQNLNKMATTLLEAFRSRRVDLYNDARLLRDLKRLSIVEKSYGHRLEGTRDEEGHCDVATAFALALPEATTTAGSGGSWGGVIRTGDVPTPPRFGRGAPGYTPGSGHFAGTLEPRSRPPSQLIDWSQYHE